jgi:hypothetical protein
VRGPGVGTLWSDARLRRRAPSCASTGRPCNLGSRRAAAGAPTKAADSSFPAEHGRGDLSQAIGTHQAAIIRRSGTIVTISKRRRGLLLLLCHMAESRRLAASPMVFPPMASHSQRHVRCRRHEHALLPTSIRPRLGRSSLRDATRRGASRRDASRRGSLPPAPQG